MGFKDLVKFNEVMLTKQVWRSLTDHSSLFYRVFKVKYFPNGSVLKAKLASGSYAWRSILKARSLIKRGMLWLVGDSTKINIYADRWLSSNGSAKIISPQVDMAKEWTVTQLIDSNVGG